MYLIGYYNPAKVMATKGERHVSIKLGFYSSPEDRTPVSDLGERQVLLPANKHSESEMELFLTGFLCGIVRGLSGETAQSDIAVLLKKDSD